MRPLELVLLLAVSALALAGSRKPRPPGPRVVPVRRPDGTVVRVFVDQRVIREAA